MVYFGITWTQILEIEEQREISKKDTGMGEKEKREVEFGVGYEIREDSTNRKRIGWDLIWT